MCPLYYLYSSFEGSPFKSTLQYLKAKLKVIWYNNLVTFSKIDHEHLMQHCTVFENINN